MVKCYMCGKVLVDLDLPELISIEGKDGGHHKLCDDCAEKWTKSIVFKYAIEDKIE